jgi:integrase
MTGSLQKKGNKWYIVLYYKDNNGKEKTKWLKTGLTVDGQNLRKAQAKLRAALAEYQTTVFVESDKSLFSNFLLDWLELHRSKIQTSTYNGYAYMVNKYIYPYFDKKKIKLESLKPMDIERYYAYLLRTTDLSPNSIIKHHQVIHKCLDFATKNKYVPENVCNCVDRPKKRFTEHSFLELTDINQLLQCVKGERIEIATLFAVYYGLRRSEILGLTWDNVDFDSDLIKIRQKVIRTFDENGKTTIEISKTLKTDASYREFPLIPELKQRLLKHKADIEDNIRFFGKEYCKQYLNFICVDESGQLLKPDYISHAYKKLVRKYDLPDSSFHSLRHSCGSLLLAMGYNIKQIQQWLGHASFQTTLNIYSHTEHDFKNNISEQLSRVLRQDD